MSSSLYSNSQTRGRWFEYVCLLATWSALFFLAVLLTVILWQGRGNLSMSFLSNFDDRLSPEKAGMLAGLWGSFWLMILTFLISVPVGIGAAIYLEEYSTDSWIARIIQVNLSNLAGVPSIVYGILGLTVFVRMFGIFAKGAIIERMTGNQVEGLFFAFGLNVPLPLGTTVISGALTLSLLVLPVIIVATQEAVRAVPGSIRHAALALGATKWQTIVTLVLPAAMPGIMTGVILSLSRAIGETAPLIMVGASTFLRATPADIEYPHELVTKPRATINAPFDEYTAMPIMVYSWAKQAQREYQGIASAGIIVLVTVLLTMNGLAIYIRNRSQQHLRW
ncbi:MAG: phosphate ABC transporter permease PstA [Planctomycetaceae bacterium]|nr:phosphate ABC transporter permease PstA [Planctomycetaceae bacterium]